MSSSLMLVFSNPSSPADESAFQQWYLTTHIPQLLANVPAMRSAVMHRVTDPDAVHRWLVVYEIDGTPDEVRQSLADGVASGAIERSSVLQTDPAPVIIFTDPFTPQAG